MFTLSHPQQYRVVAILVVVALVLSNGVATAAPAPSGAARSSLPALQAARRGNPWVNLLDGRELTTVYSGASSGKAQAFQPELASQSLAPRALVAADFDRDGSLDLVSGYRGLSGGYMTLYRGAQPQSSPKLTASGKKDLSVAFGEKAFEALASSAQVLDVPISPDLLGAGDFDADGFQDIVAATKGNATLYLLRGDGAGGFYPAEAIPLPGTITALTTGDLNRRDGLEDVVVAVASPQGAQALVFEWPEGALKGKPEVLDLAVPATALAVGQLDDHYAYDLAIAAGSDLLIISGRDRKLSLDVSQQATVSSAVIQHHALEFNITSMALGNFIWDEKANLEIALLAPDGMIQVLDSSGAIRSTLSAPHSTQIVRAKVSSLLTDDLVALDPGDRRLRILTADGQRMFPDGSMQMVVEGELATLDMESTPASVLPMRLNGDTLSDLVILAEGAGAPIVAPSAPMHTFTVDSVDANKDDSNIGDGVCLVVVHCSLRAALQEANATAGADLIGFSLVPEEGALAPVIRPEGGMPMPIVTESVVIDGRLNTFADQIELSGEWLYLNAFGFLIEGGHTTIRNFVFNRFLDRGIWVRFNGSNSFVDNVFGTSVDGLTRLGNGRGLLFESGDNEVRDCFIAGNYGPGILISQGSGNQIWGNHIGVSSALVYMGNDGHGIELDSAANTQIGDTLTDYQNVIAYSGLAGIRIAAASSGTLIVNNRIGVSITGGTARGNVIGIRDKGTSTTIGGTSAAARNLISGNASEGILLETSSNGAQIQGNYIGTNLQGTAALPNQADGIRVTDQVDDATIGGSASGAGNLISGNGAYGVRTERPYYPPSDISVQGNLIGTDKTGTLGLGNGLDGVYIGPTDRITIGGTVAGAGNIISANGRDGVRITAGSTAVVVAGNTIGLDVNGTAALGNTDDGVQAESSETTIGGAGLARNIISANGGHGITVIAQNIVANNTIGADKNGVQGHGNGKYGVFARDDNNTISGNLIVNNGQGGVSITGDTNTVQANTIRDNYGDGVRVTGSSNTIGGSATGMRNHIAGNVLHGVIIEGAAAQYNTVLGNYIGADSYGLYDEGNGQSGVEINEARYNTIGGLGAYDANVISGNDAGGLSILGSHAHDNTIQGNLIGLGVEAGPLDNDSYGVYIGDAAYNNTIGVSNTIAYNTWSGVFVESGIGNSILGNSIFSNTDMGIDLSPDTAVNSNDTGDGDTGPNNRQNFPVIASVAVSVSTSIQGVLNTRPNLQYQLQFFVNPTCDLFGYGEGQTFIGEASVQTDAEGNAGFSVLLPTQAPLGKYVTAVATGADGSSEFSKCALGAASSGPPITVNSTSDITDTNTADGVCDADPGLAGQQCTLRAALQTANALPGVNTVILPAGTYVLTRTGTGEAGGDLDITESMSLVGAGAHTTIISMTSTVFDRVLHVQNAGTVASISGVTLRGGWELVDGGGGIYNQQSALTLNAVTVRDNIGPSGGGIRNTGKLTITNSAIISNTASVYSGGGVYQNTSGTLSIANTTISSNQAQDNGGGIASLTGTVKLNNVTVVYNTADTDNSGDDGGGLYYGSGITFTAKNSIIAENVDISPGTFPNGQADCAGTFGSEGYNLIGDKAYNSGTGQTGCLGFNNNDTVGGFRIGGNYLTYSGGTSPILDENGGTTPNHALFSPYYGSAIDLANPATPGSGGNACEPFDQRGQPRPIDGDSVVGARCDRGAFEYTPVTLDIGDATVLEGNNAVFAVTLLQPAAVTVTVKYSTTAQTASAGADYVFASGTVTFPIGADTRAITVTTLADALDEDTETFLVNLGNPSFVRLGKGTGVGTLTDNSALPTLSINDAAVTEGNTHSVSFAVLTVTLAAASGQEVTVDYAAADGTATANVDYVPAQGSLTFPAGVTTRHITITVLGDNLDESNETVQVNLSNPVNAGLGDSQGTGTLADDDTAAFYIEDATMIEGDSGTSTIHLNVRLSGPSIQQTTVNYATSNGTALSGSDYLAASGGLTFPAGVTAQVITLTVNGDTAIEQNETFAVTLNTPTGGATIADGSATATIINDDGPVISIWDASVAEGNTGTTNLVMTVTLSMAAPQTVTVHYATQDGTALAGSDYISATGTLTFTVGQMTRTLTVGVYGDKLTEPNETFTMMLNDPTNATIAYGVGIGTILSDDNYAIFLPIVLR